MPALRRIHSALRSDGELSDSGGEGSTFTTTVAPEVTASESGDDVTDDDGVDDWVREEGVEEVEEDGASTPFVRASSRDARVWCIQYRSCW